MTLKKKKKMKDNILPIQLHISHYNFAGCLQNDFSPPVKVIKKGSFDGAIFILG